MQDLKTARKRAGLTALALGQAAGVNELRLYQLERGRFPPHRDEAERLAAALGMKPEKLFPALFVKEPAAK